MAVAKKKRGVSKKAAFLSAFAATASVTKAAKAAKVERQLHYRWLQEDEAYRGDFEEAKELAAQLLEDEAVRRAHEGVLEPLVYQGQFSYKQRPKKDGSGNIMRDASNRIVMENYGTPLGVLKYSDALMMFILRGLRPEKYRDRTGLEVSGPAGGPIAVHDKRLEVLGDDELAALIQISKKITDTPS
jgi:hypothetical protein